ncbi:MAG: patatin-like phospholipase family protein [Asgard group archaeon]|nr:patatin-like phospholipase family protein [Asgard group archaeon]
MSDLNHKKTAFVFSGGASLGSIEVGALKAIVEHGAQADIVLGTSVGSLNGAMFAYDPTLVGVKVMEDVWKDVKTKNVFTPSPITPVVNLTTAGQYFISPKNLRKLIKEKLPFINIEDTKIPLYIIGSDIKTGKEIVFDKGLALEALMSSAAIPGVFPPQHMYDHTIIDGGIVNNTPISTAFRLGAERAVIFPIGIPTPNKEPKNVMEILIRVFFYLLNRILTTDIHLYKDKMELIFVPPPMDVDVGPHDFSQSEKLIDEAYATARIWLETEGYKSNVEKYDLPSDVHSTGIIFRKAIEPDPEKKPVTRVKDSLQERSQKLKSSLSKTADELKTGFKETTNEIKKKLSKKETDKEN